MLLVNNETISNYQSVEEIRSHKKLLVLTDYNLPLDVLLFTTKGVSMSTNRGGGGNIVIIS